MKRTFLTYDLAYLNLAKKYITLSVKTLYTFVSTKFINILIKSLAQMYYLTHPGNFNTIEKNIRVWGLCPLTFVYY